MATSDCDDPLRVARTFVAKVTTLAERLALAKRPDSKDVDALIATADEALHRLGSSDDPIIRRCVAFCLDAKIHALKFSGQRDAAAFAAEQLVDRFGADLDPRIEKIVAPHAHRIGRTRSRLRFPGLG